MSTQDDDLNEEIRTHIDIETRLNMERGMSESDARAAALRAFGNTALVQETTRAMWGRPCLDRAMQDARYGIRALRRSPGFTATVALTMTLGIGVNTALFTIVNAFVFRAPHVAHPETLYETRMPTSAGEFEHFARHSTMLSGSAASVWVLPTFGDGAEGEVVHGNEVSAGYFAVLGTKAAAGRLFDASDYRLLGGAAIVLNYAFWERRFNADPGVIGKAVKLSGRDYTVVGVAEKGFIGTMPLLPKFWTMLPQNLEGKKSWVRMLIRLKPGVSRVQAETELTALKQRYNEARGEPGEQATVLLESRRTLLPLVNRTRWLIAVLMFCVGMVLLIACANVANLLLARAATRQREIAVRLSLGASRTRLLQQLLTESIIVAFLGGVGALAISAWLMPAALLGLQSFLPPIWGEWAVDLTPDLRVFAYTAALCLLSGIVFGLTPALQSTKPDLTAALKSSGAQGARLARSPLRSGLVVTQIALSLVLLINAGLLTRSLRNAHTADPGIDVDRTLVLQLDLRDDMPRRATHARILDRVRDLPGVESVSAAHSVPLLAATMAPARDGASSSGNEVRTAYNHVTAAYFQTLGIPLVLGRTFSDDEERGYAPVAVISESAARKLYPGENPIGRVLRLMLQDAGRGAFNHTSVVIGVAKDTRSIRLSEIDPAYVYLPMSPNHLAHGAHIFVRAGEGSDSLLAPLRKATFDLATGHQLLIYPFDMAIDYQRLPAQAGAWISGVLGGLAMVLACVGIYGVISSSVSQRTHEIGVRMALGANPRDVVALILKQGMRLVIIGTAIGGLGAAPLAQMLRFMLYGISPLDPWAFAGVPVLLGVLALIAMIIPTLRAARVQPVRALRCE